MVAPMGEEPVSPARPVTLMFTDVENSTSLWDSHVHSMLEALEVHNAAMRSVLARHQGYEVKTEGDAFMISFPSPHHAIRCAVEMQTALLEAAWPDALSAPGVTPECHKDGTLLHRGLRVRIGIHAGPAFVRTDPLTGRKDYFGPAVNRAARVASSAHGGQIVISQAAFNAVEGDAQVFQHCAAVELGSFWLKGLQTPERIFQVSPLALQQRTFLPLKASGARETRLPGETTSFVGRATELSRLHHCIGGSARLVTLCGPGGVGKTRLALRFAHALTAGMPGHAPAAIWFCDLSDATTEEAAVAKTATTLAFNIPRGGTDVMAAVGRHLAEQGEALLVLDNLEQLGEHGTGFVHICLSAAPQLRVLATSRHQLGLPGEHIVDVAPLPLPAHGNADSDAVSLFVERAKAADQAFSPTEEVMPTVAALVRKLDGLPLALEIAAARLSVMGPKLLLERLSERFDIIRRSNGGRHAALRAVMDGSWDLLSATERQALARWSVFQGGFGVDAAGALLDNPDNALELLQRLRQKSLVQVVDPAAPRFGMLESIRAYAGLRLAEMDSGRSAQDAHAEYFVDLGLRHSALARTGNAASLAVLSEEAENLQAVFAHHAAMESLHELRRCAGAALALQPVWSVQGPHGAYRNMLESIAAHATHEALPKTHASEVFGALSDARWIAGDAVGALQANHSALRFAEEAGDISLQVTLLLKVAAMEQDLLHTTALDRALAAQKKAADTGRPQLKAQVACTLGRLSLARGDLTASQRHLDEARNGLRARGHCAEECHCLLMLAVTHVFEGRMEQAAALQHSALAVAEALEDKRLRGIVLGYLGIVGLMRGELSAAESHGSAAVDLMQQCGDQRLEQVFLASVAAIHAAMGKVTQAGLEMARIQPAPEAQDRYVVAAKSVALFGGVVDVARERADPGAGHIDVARRTLAAVWGYRVNGTPLLDQSDDVRLAYRTLQMAVDSAASPASS